MERSARKLALAGLAGAAALGGSLGALALAGASPAQAQGAVSSATFQFQDVVSNSSHSVSLSGSGAIDFAHDQASLSAQVPASLAQHLPGAGAGATTLQVVVSGGTLYLSWPGLASVDGGKPWVSASPPARVRHAVSKALGTAASELGDVSGIVQFARNHHATVTSLGTQTIDGVSASGTQITATFHRRAFVHHRRGVDRVRLGALARVLHLLDHPATGGASGHGVDLSAQLWANQSNQLVRGSLRRSGPKGGSASTQVDLSGYDQPVTITVPSSAQTRQVRWERVAKAFGLEHPKHRVR